MRVATIVGARPQFIKAGPVGRELRRRHREILVHTGQHYDPEMSRVFFEELGLPRPDFLLGVGSGNHGWQTGQMLARIEEVLLSEGPDCVVVYGDTNSTLAGALAASKLRIPVVHVEAGLRSFRREMPEEQNRVLVDHLARVLLCPGSRAAENLAREGIGQGIHVVGDVMADVLQDTLPRARARSDVLSRLGVEAGCYVLITLHRAENTDDATRLGGILRALEAVGEPVVFPLHPRTRRAAEALGWSAPSHVRVTPPLGYLDMLLLESRARTILTDSGGVQKEAYWLGVPCLTLREETEWSETVELGWNCLVGADSERILDAIRRFSPPARRPTLYGEGTAAVRCVAALEQELHEERSGRGAD